MTARQFFRAITLLCAIAFTVIYIGYIAGEIASNKAKAEADSRHALTIDASGVRP